eukprot:TRINITY_DN18547_c0_g1_i1.p1 TRINITY_DN18547_c0_g1~~TRINITY_DN18547_c0_g1_i1.p1  ORF type:complete len:933 (+),score=401.13 TRINITY_DN18547_c0_g1_i1:182-2980(+)
MKHFLVSDSQGNAVYFDHPDGLMLCLPMANAQLMMSINFGGDGFSSMSVDGRRLFVFAHYEPLYYTAVSDEPGETDAALRMQLRVLRDLLYMQLGPHAIQRPRGMQTPHKQMKALQRISDTMCWMAGRHHAQLLDAVEWLEVNDDIKQTTLDALRRAVDQLVPHTGLHGLVFVGTKLLAQFGGGGGMRGGGRHPGASGELHPGDVALLSIMLHSHFDPHLRDMIERLIPVADYSDHAAAAAGAGGGGGGPAQPAAAANRGGSSSSRPAATEADQPAAAAASGSGSGLHQPLANAAIASSISISASGGFTHDDSHSTVTDEGLMTADEGYEGYEGFMSAAEDWDLDDSTNSIGPAAAGSAAARHSSIDLAASAGASRHMRSRSSGGVDIAAPKRRSGGTWKPLSPPAAASGQAFASVLSPMQNNDVHSASAGDVDSVATGEQVAVQLSQMLQQQLLHLAGSTDSGSDGGLQLPSSTAAASSVQGTAASGTQPAATAASQQQRAATDDDADDHGWTAAHDGRRRSRSQQQQQPQGLERRRLHARSSSTGSAAAAAGSHTQLLHQYKQQQQQPQGSVDGGADGARVAADDDVDDDADDVDDGDDGQRDADDAEDDAAADDDGALQPPPPESLAASAPIDGSSSSSMSDDDSVRSLGAESSGPADGTEQAATTPAAKQQHTSHQPHQPPTPPFYGTLYLRNALGTVHSGHTVYMGELHDGVYLVLVARPGTSGHEQQQQQAVQLAQSVVKRALKNYVDYLRTKARTHLSPLAYVHRCPGLVHFVFVDRTANRLVAPTLGPLHGQQRTPPDDASAQLQLEILRRKVWDMCCQAQQHVSQGYCSMLIKAGDFQYSYRLWVEDATGAELDLALLATPRGATQAWPREPLSYSFYKELVRRTPKAVKCYELLTLYLAVCSVPQVHMHNQTLLALLTNRPC